MAQNMHKLILAFLLACLAGTQAQPVEVGDAVVEIERQRLVKFPDDLDQRRDTDSHNNTRTNKQDEAKRILEEIEKINHALGYVRKQPEQPKLPPILDSSQYLFPKPAMQPFHQQSHQAAGSNGETILIPSIRAIRLGDQYSVYPPSGAARTTEYNAPVRKHTKHNTRSKLTTSSTRQHASSSANGQLQYFYRPNQVLVPTPQKAGEQQTLPTHFVIPVRLYKLNKEEYLRKHAPQEYRVKGYKIVGDIEHFYGKTKTKNKGQKHKSTPKYHLFFLPREMALNKDSTLKYPTPAKENLTVVLPESQPMQPQENNSREEKLANRPFKLQATATTNNNNGVASNNATTQVVRKRVVPKPLRDKETNVGAMAVQQLPSGGLAQTSTSIRITPQPGALVASANSNLNAPLPAGTTANFNGVPHGNNVPTGAAGNLNNNNNNNNFNAFNLRPAGSNSNSNNNNNNQINSIASHNVPPIISNANEPKNNNTAASAIKNAFQNIFKFPFRQEAKPELAATESPNLQTVPLQMPPKTFFATQSLLPQPFYTAPQNHDYKWDDEAAESASNTDEDGDDSGEQEQKKIFGHHGHFQQQQQQQHDTNREAIKQGGIVIQRLKVRKGGIAIAGPGGVATAGSGGTAIVGPGGYALTHPRSLTIAGPGAKVIAIPPNVELQDALQRTNLGTQSFPREGKIVATGPTVYYAPDTDTGTVVAA